MKINDFLELLQPHTVDLKDFEQVGNTPFRLNAMNGIYAPAKTGKTRFVLEQLEPIAAEGKHHVIWLDGDRNIELRDLIECIHHEPIKSPSRFLQILIENNERLDGYIFIIDSFKNFSFGKNLDDNTQCQEIFTEYQKVMNLGATLIIIFHATKIMNYGAVIGFKTKGNEDTIESNMDFYYKFERTNQTVTLTIQCARDANMRIGDTIPYADINYVTQRICKAVTESGEQGITLRDLKRQAQNHVYEPMIDSLRGIVYELELVKNGNKGRPREVVHLL